MQLETDSVLMRALLHTGDVLVEVEGTVRVPRLTRFSDMLSAPDQMQEVQEAAVTRHLPRGLQQELAPLITINRDGVLLATEAGERSSSGLAGLRITLDPYRVKLLCPGFEVTGTIHVPSGGSPYFLVTTGGGRFIGLTEAEVTSSTGQPLPSFGGRLPFCLVNRSRVQVVIGAGPVPGASEAGAPAAEASPPV